MGRRQIYKDSIKTSVVLEKDTFNKVNELIDSGRLMNYRVKSFSGLVQKLCDNIVNGYIKANSISP